MWWYLHSSEALPMTTSLPNQPHAWFHHELWHRPPWFAVCCRPVPDQYPAMPRTHPVRMEGECTYHASDAKKKARTHAASSWHPPRPEGTRPRVFSSGAMISSRTRCWMRR